MCFRKMFKVTDLEVNEFNFSKFAHKKHLDYHIFRLEITKHLCVRTYLIAITVLLLGNQENTFPKPVSSCNKGADDKAEDKPRTTFTHARLKNACLFAKQGTRISAKMLSSPRFATKITMRCSSREQSPLRVVPPLPHSFLSLSFSLSLLSLREKKKEFLPRFSARVDLGHTLLFTCRRLGVSALSRLSRILVPILLLSLS